MARFIRRRKATSERNFGMSDNELLQAIENIQDLLNEYKNRYSSNSLIERVLNICDEVLNER